MWLHDRLHAKYFRTEGAALLGSANLTGAALGWSSNPNLELLTDTPLQEVRNLEQRLRTEGVVATQEMAIAVEAAATTLPRPVNFDLAAGELPSWSGWLPTLRQPSDLFVAYQAGPQRLSNTSAQSAALDLAVLDLAPGLTKDQFYGVIGIRLLQQPIIASVDELLSEPRRFGHVTSHLRSRVGVDKAEGDVLWQTLMRWLFEFLPGRYSRAVPNRSEVVYRTGQVSK